MHSYVVRIAASAALGLALLAPGAAAHARTLPAIDGKPNDPADPISCWAWFPIATTRQGLERTCAGTFAIDFAVPIDTPGTKWLELQVTRPTDKSQLSCQAYAVTNTGGYVPGPVVNLKTAPSESFQAMDLPPIRVSSGGTLWVRCLMAKGTRILGIDLLNP